MGLKTLLARLQTPAADTPDTPQENTGYQRKPSIHAGCTPDTPDTPQFHDSEVTEESAPDLDRWAWPHSDAMNAGEIAAFAARLTRFAGKGLSVAEAEALADRLVIRDRGGDDRRLCLECVQLSSKRCNAWQRAGLGAPALPADLMLMLQRCDAFAEVNQ